MLRVREGKKNKRHEILLIEQLKELALSSKK